MDKTALMRRCLELAKRASGYTSPNPMVGALLYKDGKVIAEDYHKKPGTPHAEALVLNQAGALAKGATLFVNLEPCCHKPKRTPPCTDAIVAAKVKEVIVAMEDPNPLVSGRGIAMLKDAGITVECGVEGQAAHLLNETYVKYIRTKTPFVILKVAMTLDGKIATPDGHSKWITGQKARELVHRIRGEVDAILTAVGTVKADNPQLTARPQLTTSIEGLKSPIRVIIDPEFEITANYNVLKTPPPTILVVKNKQGRQFNSFPSKDIDVIFYDKQLDLKWLMQELGKRQITSVLVEGGTSLSGHVIEEEIVDKVMFFIAPKIVGGVDSYVPVGGKSFKTIADPFYVKNLQVQHVGDDLLIEGYLK
ncbi:MAG: bifunctional diaminohydroxyphosphoribosylaminopyrimidine deaminase/5-amino-6-(5-phosphoribosylamino)uracil reductase RibD [Candidatus Magnetoovum sp. WYHC-5]|nr:bifunctional diaminohydroxyphosphoribosylaminopyrimidine deaminase/5-amino-6-(5-phosphoribosylamino)uracil reductase RibD [Candidatus Magnetoovum sp. WYHC-5]